MLNDAGHTPLNSYYQMKPTTLQNYTAELAMTSELSLTQSSIVKPIHGLLQNIQSRVQLSNDVDYKYTLH